MPWYRRVPWYILSQKPSAIEDRQFLVAVLILAFWLGSLAGITDSASFRINVDENRLLESRHTTVSQDDIDERKEFNRASPWRQPRPPGQAPELFLAHAVKQRYPEQVLTKNRV